MRFDGGDAGKWLEGVERLQLSEKVGCRRSLQSATERLLEQGPLLTPYNDYLSFAFKKEMAVGEDVKERRKMIKAGKL